MENEEWLVEFREFMSDFRKAVYEFAQSDDMEDYKRMMAAQRALYEHAQRKT